MLKRMLASITLTLCLATTAGAMEIDIEMIDLRPIQNPTINVSISGEIRAGDADRLEAALSDYDHLDMRDMLFLFDSPGGNLFEGKSIGEIIAKRGEITSAQVGSSDTPEAICASACVLAYLGADYRYLAESGRIGVHQFSAPGSDMSGSQAMSQAQTISATLVLHSPAAGGSGFLRADVVNTGREDRLGAARTPRRMECRDRPGLRRGC